MANIKHLEMAKKVFSYQHINVKKGFLGLTTTVTYQPTNSPVHAQQLEYTPTDGSKIERLITLSGTQLMEQVKKMEQLNTVPNGNYRLDLCFSGDHQFAALQLFQFKDFSYQSVSDGTIYEGHDAVAILKPFILDK